MRRSTLLFALFAMFLGAEAQPYIEFKEKTFDFGAFPESDGEVAHYFEFENTGTAPLVISKVKTSCGCTTPEFPKIPIAPGEKGEIKITYSASGRPGKFTKFATVISNSTISQVTLTITGDVIGYRFFDGEIYDYDVNGLKLKALHLSLGNLLQNGKKRVEINIANPTDKSLDLGISNLPRYLSAKVEPTKLSPGKKGKISIVYDAAKLNDWGEQSDAFLLTVRNSSGKVVNKKITLAINIVEDFGHLSDSDIADAPVVNISSLMLNFGQIESNVVTEKRVEIKNIGKTELIVRKVSSDTQTVNVKCSKTKIKPGTVSNIIVSLNPKGRKGILNERITIITDDPKHPVVYVQVTASFK